MRVQIKNITGVGRLGCFADRACLNGGYQPKLRLFLYQKGKKCRQQPAGMRRPSAASNRREPIAFSGSSSDVPNVPQYVEGIQPTTTPTFEDRHRAGAPGSVLVAGAILGVGLACTIVWQRLSRKWTGKRQRPGADSEFSRQRRQHSSTLPDSLKALTPQQTRNVQYDDSRPESRAAPVIANSSTLLGQVQAVQSRITEQQEAPGGSADSNPNPSEGLPSPLGHPSAFDEAPTDAQSPSSNQSNAVHQMDVEHQRPWDASDSEESSDTNVLLSLSDDSSFDDAEVQADAVERATSQLSVDSDSTLPHAAQDSEPVAAEAALETQREINSTPSGTSHDQLTDDRPPAPSSSSELLEQPSTDTKTNQSAQERDRADSQSAVSTTADVTERLAASQPEAVGIEPGKVVMTTPLEDAAAQHDAPSKPPSADTGREAQTDKSASEPVSVTTQDGQVVMTTPLEDAASLKDPAANTTDKGADAGLDQSAAKAVALVAADGSTIATMLSEGTAATPNTDADADLDQSASEPVAFEAADRSTVATMPSEDASAPDEAQTDAVEETDALDETGSVEDTGAVNNTDAIEGTDALVETDAFEELQQAAFADDEESLKPPGLAALDASMLDVPGSNVERAPQLFQKPPQGTEGLGSSSKTDTDSQPQPPSYPSQARPSDTQPSDSQPSDAQLSPPQRSETESDVPNAAEATLKEDAETNEALSAIASEPAAGEEQQQSEARTSQVPDTQQRAAAKKGAQDVAEQQKTQADAAGVSVSGQPKNQADAAESSDTEQRQAEADVAERLSSQQEEIENGLTTSSDSLQQQQQQQQSEATITSDSDSEQREGEAAESEAAELRRQITELRQTMADKAAALEAAQAQASSQQPYLSSQQAQSQTDAQSPSAQSSQQEKASTQQSNVSPQLDAQSPSGQQLQPESTLRQQSESLTESQSQSPQDAQSPQQTIQQSQAQSDTEQQLPAETQSKSDKPQLTTAQQPDSGAAPTSSDLSSSSTSASQPSSSQTEDDKSTQPESSSSASSSLAAPTAPQTPSQEPFKVLPRPPSSSSSATIFIEPSPAPETVESHPVSPDRRGGEGGDLLSVAAAAVLPHPDKAETGGEDAYFVSSYGQGAFGVADGVGGWNTEGVDPSRYSRLLMEFAEEAILQGQGDFEGGAQDVVGLAHAGITRQGEQEGAIILGSCTVCLAVLKPGGLLEVANVGDSGFRIIRGNEMAFASEAQQHEFNMPFQLACPGPDQYSDTCEDACVYELELEAGDVIVLATDGVLDNLWDDQMAQLVFQCLRDSPRTEDKVKECALQIVETAQQNSFDPKFRSPWVVEAARAGALPFWKRFRPEGGKVDDCTVIVVALESAAGKFRQAADKPKATAAA